VITTIIVQFHRLKPDGLYLVRCAKRPDRLAPQTRKFAGKRPIAKLDWLLSVHRLDIGGAPFNLSSCWLWSPPSASGLVRLAHQASVIKSAPWDHSPTAALYAGISPKCRVIHIT